MGSSGGAIRWFGSDGIILNSMFTNNIAINWGGAVQYYYNAHNCLISNSTFIGNTVNANGGGGVSSWAQNTHIIGSKFINNTSKGNNGGGGANLDNGNAIILDSIFIGNYAHHGGGITVGINSNLSNSIFTNNSCSAGGGGIYFYGNNCILTGSTFINNIAKGKGGAIYLDAIVSIVNCKFINSKWINSNSNSNGIFTSQNLNINGGKGIVDLVAQRTISGISVVVLNNETYYYPPNTNINFTNKKQLNTNS